MKPKRGDVVDVVWRDSMRMPHGWDTAKRYRRGARVWPSCRTAGYLLDLTKDHVCVALSVDTGNGNASEAVTIPREAVVAIHTTQRSHKRVRWALR